MKRIFILLTYITACVAGFAAADPSVRLQVTPEQRKALGIEVGAAQKRQLVPRPQLPARITLPNTKVRIVSARSAGLLLSPLVAVGDSISAGDELARIESPAFVALQREYLEALSQRDLARSTARRESQLAEEGIIAGRRAAQSAALLRDADARLDERRQALSLSGMSDEGLSNLNRSRRLHSTLVLRAPLDGVVLEQYAQAGERLDAGGALYRIGDLTSLTVDIHAPVDVSRSLEAGTRFVIPDRGVAGRVIAVGSEIHSLDQGVLVRGEIEDGETQLRPGEFVRVQFETPRPHGSAFAIPAAAVVHVDRRAWVFRETEGGFEPVSVEMVGGSGREAVVAGSLADGATVAIRGTAALKAHWLSNGGPS